MVAYAPPYEIFVVIGATFMDLSIVLDIEPRVQ